MGGLGEEVERFLLTSTKTGSSISLPMFFPLSYISFWLPKLCRLVHLPHAREVLENSRRILGDDDAVLLVPVYE